MNLSLLNGCCPPCCPYWQKSKITVNRGLSLLTHLTPPIKLLVENNTRFSRDPLESLYATILILLIKISRVSRVSRTKAVMKGVSVVPTEINQGGQVGQQKSVNMNKTENFK